MKQARDVSLYQKHVTTLEGFLARPGYAGEGERLGLSNELSKAKARLEHVASPAYLQELQGTLGADPILAQNAAALVTGRGANEHAQVLN